MAGWWIYTYQDIEASGLPYGIRDFAGNWKQDLVQRIKEQSLNRIRSSESLIEAGMNVVLTASIGIDYHWFQNNIELTGETSRTLTLNEIGEDKTGVYVCAYKYGSTAISTDPLELQVSPAGSLPAGGLAALSILTVAVALAGVRRMRRYVG